MHWLFIFLLSFAACNSSKKSAQLDGDSQSKTIVDQSKSDTEEPVKDDTIKPKTPKKGDKEKSPKAASPEVAAVPDCIIAMIDVFKSEPMSNPPRRIVEYNYKGELCYYVTAPCCDQFTKLYSSSCELICSPDGGFTGKGDGKCNDFRQEAETVRLVWEDERNPKPNQEQLNDMD